MSDYLFMLDNHLDTAQNRAVAIMQELAGVAGVNLWLTGGAMRDMLRGAPIRDLDFTVERGAPQIAKEFAAKTGGNIVSEDALKRGSELLLPGDVHIGIENARSEKYSKPGGKPQVTPATIHEDLLRRDFTINAIALSLSRGSKGLLIDPANGQADLTNHELRTANSHAFFDDPVRLVRMIRLQHGLQFQLAPRTQSQYENAQIEEWHKLIPAEVVASEIRKAMISPNLVATLDALADSGILANLSPALAGEKRNTVGLSKLEKLAQSVLPPDQTNYALAFLAVMIEKLNTRERAEALRAFDLSKNEVDALKHMEERVKKLESSLKSAAVKRPSHVYDILHPTSLDTILLTLCRSAQRIVHDRIKTYYSKYLPMAQEVTEEEVLATGVKPGTPKFDKAMRVMVTQRLNARPKKVEIPEVMPAPPIIPAPMVRGARAR